MTRIDPVVILRRVIRARREAVFRAWTDPTMLQRWLAPGPNVVEHVETDLRVGGAFLLRSRGPDGARHSISGRYEVIAPDHRLRQTWIYDGPLDLLPGEETMLQIDLAPIGEGSTDLLLTHRRISDATIRDAYRGDWPSCFDKLQTALD